MKRYGFLVAGLSVVLCAALLLPSPNALPKKGAFAAQPRWDHLPAPALEPSSTEPSSFSRQQIVASHLGLPLSFEANHGQTDERVDFLSRGSHYSLFLTGNEAVLALSQPEETKRTCDPEEMLRLGSSQTAGHSNLITRTGPEILGCAQEGAGGRDTREGGVQEAKPTRSVVLRMKLLGTNPASRVAGLEKLQGKSNYFLGNDPRGWRTNIPTYAKVKYQGVYPGVDLVYHGSQQQLEYDFLVAPRADPGVIRLSFQGADALEIDAHGDLVLRTHMGEIREHKPEVYQEIAGIRQAIRGGYVLHGNHEVSFAITQYDTSKSLVIDPTLSYSTYLGGAGSEYGAGIAVDNAGNVYVTGRTFSTDFPTMSPLQASRNGPSDAFIAKIDTTKSGSSSLVYSTYLGGNGDDNGAGIAVDGAGNVYVTGQTFSTDFPTTPGALQTALSRNGDAFVTKLNPTGSALVYSTYLGGNQQDVGFAIAVDSLGNAYVTGGTQSSDFPTASPLQPSIGGGTCSGSYSFGGPCADAFVSKLNPTGSALVYSTYLGGNQEDIGFGIAVDSLGNAYVTGHTQSSNFPTANPLQPSIGGGTCFGYYSLEPCADAFAAKLNSTGSALVFSTYFGGNNDDRAAGIAVDSSGNSYVTGHTSSVNFPTKNAIQASLRGSSDAFVAKLDATGSAVAYSTYLGGNNFDDGRGVAVDSSGDAYVAGTTNSTDFPTVSPVQVLNSGSHLFITKLNPAASALVYSSYLGGKGSEAGGEIAVDTAGNAYLTGYTTSANFPTKNPFQVSLRGFSDAFIAKIAPIPGPAVALSSTSLSFQQQPINTTSPPQMVTLTNRGDGALMITGITITGSSSGDFAQTNTCGVLPATLASDASCDFSVTFTPTATGTRNGTVAISDNAAGSPRDVSLQGNFVPPDFSISTSPDAATVSAGASATSTLTISSLNDFAGGVSLNCTGLPALANCVFSPNPVTPGANSTASSTLTISTIAGSGFLEPPFGRLRVKPLYAFWLALLGMAFVGVGFWQRRFRKRRIGAFTLGLLLILIALQASCGGDRRRSGSGTPPGTYPITLTGRSSSLQHTTSFTLTVR